MSGCAFPLTCSYSSKNRTYVLWVREIKAQVRVSVFTSLLSEGALWIQNIGPARLWIIRRLWLPIFGNLSRDSTHTKGRDPPEGDSTYPMRLGGVERVSDSRIRPLDASLESRAWTSRDLQIEAEVLSKTPTLSRVLSLNKASRLGATLSLSSMPLYTSTRLCTSTLLYTPARRCISTPQESSAPCQSSALPQTKARFRTAPP